MSSQKGPKYTILFHDGGMVFKKKDEEIAAEDGAGSDDDIEDFDVEGIFRPPIAIHESKKRSKRFWFLVILLLGGVGATAVIALGSGSSPSSDSPTDSPSVGGNKAPVASPAASPTAAPSLRPTLPPTIVSSEIAKFLGSDGVARDFGLPVAISGNTIVVGAHFDDENGDDAGSVYVYQLYNDNWSEVVKLTASDGVAGDSFGRPVAIDGNTIVVGAKGAGSAYVFEFDNDSWSEVAKLSPSDDDGALQFGKSVAISGNTIVVGASRDNSNGKDSGSAYIFQFANDSWSEVSKLTASDAAADHRFGNSVAVEGNTIVVGTRFREDGNGPFSGSAYVFQFNNDNWSEVSKLMTSDGAGDDRFGGSVAIRGNTIVVGASNDKGNGSFSGAAYVYEFANGSWSEMSKLTSSDGVSKDWFGYSVAISGNTIVVGAYGDDDNGDASGSAYVFQLTNKSWSEVAKLTSSDGAASDWFGASVAIDGDTIAVGAYGDDYNGDTSGSAYVWEI